MESTPAWREPYWLNPWIAGTVAVGWLVEPTPWGLSGIDELLLAALPAVIVWRQVLRTGRRQGLVRALALSVVGAAMATEGLVTVGTNPRFSRSVSSSFIS